MLHFVDAWFDCSSTTNVLKENDKVLQACVAVIVSAQVLKWMGSSLKSRTFAIIQQLASGHLLTCISIREASQKKRFRTFSYTEHPTRQPSQFLEEASLSIITFTYVLVVLHVLVFAFLRVLPSFSSHPAISWSSSVFLLIFPSNLFDHEPCSSFSLLLVRLFSRPYMSMPDFLLPFFVNLPIHCQYSHSLLGKRVDFVYLYVIVIVQRDIATDFLIVWTLDY